MSGWMIVVRALHERGGSGYASQVTSLDRKHFEKALQYGMLSAERHRAGDPIPRTVPRKHKNGGMPPKLYRLTPLGIDLAEGRIEVVSRRASLLIDKETKRVVGLAGVGSL